MDPPSNTTLSISIKLFVDNAIVMDGYNTMYNNVENTYLLK